ncbi:MAG: hypothetical protein LBT19_00215 [Candidatus Nomurabacteria bacterium]|nr:hypothetical protein [Candidatus Nomurabacteria bacterium]
MDNETYLKHIAAQSRPVSASSKLLSPNVIKLIAGAVIALILIIVLGSVLSSANQKTIGLYERFYLRLQNFSKDNGPLVKYTNDLKSSDLRSLAGTLKTSLTVTARDVSSLLSTLKVDVANISAEASADEAIVLATYEGELLDAKMNGLLDRNFATATTLQISLLLSLESEIREKSDSVELATIIDKSRTDLEALRVQFKNYSDSH